MVIKNKYDEKYIYIAIYFYIAIIVQIGIIYIYLYPIRMGSQKISANE